MDLSYLKSVTVQMLRDIAEEKRRPKEEQRPGEMFDNLAAIVDAFWPDTPTESKSTDLESKLEAENKAALHVARTMGPDSVVARVVVNPATGEQRYVTSAEDRDYESLKSAVTKPVSTTIVRVSDSAASQPEPIKPVASETAPAGPRPDSDDEIGSLLMKHRNVIVAYLRESAERGWGSSGALPSRETLLLAASFIEAGKYLNTKVEG